MATCTATIRTGNRKGELCGKRLRGREFCGYHDGRSAAPKKRCPRRRVPPPLEGEACSICFDTMPEKYTKLGCGHYYHTECISDWFQSSDNRVCCLCRKIDVATVIPGLEVARPPAPTYVPMSPSTSPFRPVYPASPSGFVIVIDDDDDGDETFVAPSFEVLMQLSNLRDRIEELDMLIRRELRDRYEE